MRRSVVVGGYSSSFKIGMGDVEATFCGEIRVTTTGAKSNKLCWSLAGIIALTRNTANMLPEVQLDRVGFNHCGVNHTIDSPIPFHTDLQFGSRQWMITAHSG